MSAADPCRKRARRNNNRLESYSGRGRITAGAATTTASATTASVQDT
jgi:hypothetical protein